MIVYKWNIICFGLYCLFYGGCQRYYNKILKLEIAVVSRDRKIEYFAFS
ncbi:hypothetical protein PROSTU_02155 [Providencia stuartii ATCC 25827]|uniref:Uncharacterized protein n=1 Tax=Providencia stuartii ATCC 25827 TaxID=471874 RepID=A0AA86YII0_PROST|nr:hypothetical protein PROSTU_02155 [Providencia stuartii ATCC 25827]